MYVCSCSMCICISTDQSQASTQELVELKVLNQFYDDLQIVLPIDKLLPQLVTKKIVTINDKILISESGKNINERSQFFLEHYIAKPLSAGDPVMFYRLLQVMDASNKCIVLAAKIKQSLDIEYLQDKISSECIAIDMIAMYVKVYIFKHDLLNVHM